MQPDQRDFMQSEGWSAAPLETVQGRLGATGTGLTSAEAARRLATHGPNEVVRADRTSALRLLWAQLSSPLVLILVVAAVISLIAQQWTDAGVVIVIVLASSAVGFWREYRASRLVDALRHRISARVLVLRDGVEQKVLTREVVPGDVLVLKAGSLIAADGLVLEARDFFVSESVLTGESFPVEKQPGVLPQARALSERRNAVFLGTHVRSGLARALVIDTGKHTQFGQIAGRLRMEPPETDFDRGLRQFGQLLTWVMVVMTFLVLALNLLANRPGIASLLFAVALAVGLAPELLPAILAINLARSAASMAKQGVLVRRLNAIENFGSMTVLCTDKTGTLTEGVMRLHAALDLKGSPSAAVLELAYFNAVLQSGVANPLDEALVAAGRAASVQAAEKLDEIPFDFIRKRLSVVVGPAATPRLITKGAVSAIVSSCAGLDEAARKEIDAFVASRGAEGFRVLAVATRALPPQHQWSKSDEHDLHFEGFLLFADPLRADVPETVASLQKLGVSLKIVTGDNVHVAKHLAQLIGLSAERVLTGAELATLHDEALWQRAERIDVFAEVEPNQKERIILALKKMNHVVGYMGDGINDAPALHAADVSISVESAVDVAREAADFVLLQRSLATLREGVIAGRKTFANTLKYVMTTTSANLGNMLSMAAASLVLPFFPVLPGQILLNNFLSDIPAVGLASDAVDPEWIARPHRWDMKAIRHFMFRFGALSSMFDLLTFSVLLVIFEASPPAFRTGWFVESLLTELLVALVLRTRKAAWRSRPGKLLLWSTIAVALLALAIPYLPGAQLLEFVPLPLPMLAALVAITVGYVLATEALKRRFFPHS